MSNHPLATPHMISAAERRYGEAYGVANTLAGLGDSIRGLGIVVGILLSFAAFVTLLSRGGWVVAGIIETGAVTGGAIVYVLGILIATQGQILKASLDSAVNSSPFLPDEIRARILSLPVDAPTSPSPIPSAGS